LAVEILTTTGKLYNSPLEECAKNWNLNARDNSAVNLWAAVEARLYGNIYWFCGERADTGHPKRAEINGQSVDLWRWKWRGLELAWSEVKPTYVPRDQCPAEVEWSQMAYVECHLDSGPDCWRVSVSAPGTMRYKVRAALGKQEKATPGREATHYYDNRIRNKEVRRTYLWHHVHTEPFVQRASQWLNVPFIHCSKTCQEVGLNTNHNYIGVDCAELPNEVYRVYFKGQTRNDIHAYQWPTYGIAVDEWLPGDLVLFDYTGDGLYDHTVIYVGSIPGHPGESGLWASYSENVVLYGPMDTYTTLIRAGAYQILHLGCLEHEHGGE